MKSVKPYRSKVPVICIGNLVMGGVGKTPLAISVAEFFKMNGKRPVFLTRGYGGGMLFDYLNDYQYIYAWDFVFTILSLFFFLVLCRAWRKRLRAC